MLPTAPRSRPQPGQSPHGRRIALDNPAPPVVDFMPYPMAGTRIRSGLSDYLAVADTDIVVVSLESHAREVARAILESGDPVWGHVPGEPPDAAEQRLVEALMDGRLALVQTERHPRPLDQPEVTPLAELRRSPPVEPPPLPRTDAPAEPEPVAAETYFALRVTTQTGGSFAGVAVDVTLPGGTPQEAVLDSRSSIRIDGVRAPGEVRVDFPVGLAPNPEANPVTEVDLTATPVVSADVGVFHGDTGIDHAVAIDLPGPRCVRLVGALFALNKAFVLPETMEGIRLLSHMYGKMSGATLLVVGHTDTTGSSSRNRSLSLQRAQSMLQFMTDDVDGWYAYYGKDTDYSRRWGGEEDLAMLSVLPDATLPYYDESHADHSLEAALTRFQDAKGLPPTGKADEATRRALIADYMAIDETSLPEDVDAVAHGCGEHFLAVETADGVDEVENRRVEVFLFPDGIDPPTAGQISAKGSAEYPAWVEAIVEQRTFRPGAAGLGSLEVVTDIEEEEQVASGVVFVLRSTDGAYDRELLPTDGTVVHGYTVLEFTDMPIVSFYSLHVRYASGNELPLFEDVPFRELHHIGNQGVEELIDPFTLKRVPTKGG